MPVVDDKHTPQHQVLINQSILKRLKEDVDIVICSTSTIGLEAYLYGKKAISYIPENLLAADPLLEIEDKRIYKWYEGESIDINFIRKPSSDFHIEDIATMKRRYFGKINDEVWLKCARA